MATILYFIQTDENCDKALFDVHADFVALSSCHEANKETSFPSNGFILELLQHIEHHHSFM